MSCNAVRMLLLLAALAIDNAFVSGGERSDVYKAGFLRDVQVSCYRRWCPLGHGDACWGIRCVSSGWIKRDGKKGRAMHLRGGAASGRGDIRGWQSVGGHNTKGTKRREKGGGGRSLGMSQRGREISDEEQDDDEEEESWGEKNVPLGKHLMPVVRPKKSETPVAKATVLSMDEGVARKKERDREKARSKVSAAGAVHVTVDQRKALANAKGEGGLAVGVLPISPRELRKLSKGALLKLAKESGLKVTCEDKSLLSNREVRSALEPFLAATETLEALSREGDASSARKYQRKKGHLPPTSKYLSSAWVDGEERSVYGAGHPKDSDFVRWAAECVSELEERERVNPSGAPRSKKERAELVHETAQRFSDQFFTMILTGQVKVSKGASISLPGVHLAPPAPVGQGGTSGEQGGAGGTSGEAAQNPALEREADEGVGSHVRRMWGEGDEGLLELEQGDELKARKEALVEGGQEEEGDEGMANVAFEVQSSGEEAIRDRWDMVEQRDFSIYSVAQLNEKLHQAAIDGHVGAISALASAGARVNSVLSPASSGFTARGWTPLFGAAYMGHVAAAERLLQLGANVSRTTELECTALDMAITGPTDVEQSAQIVELLVQYGADVGRYNGGGWQPCHSAALFGRCGMLVRLVELGANLTACVANSSRTALDLASANGRVYTAAVIRELLHRSHTGALQLKKLKRKRASSPQPRDMGDSECDLGVGSYSDVMSADTIVATANKLQLWNDSENGRLEEEVAALFPPSSADDCDAASRGESRGESFSSTTPSTSASSRLRATRLEGGGGMKNN